MSSFEIAVRSLLGTVFLVSSLSKARDRAAYRGFVRSLAHMRVGPPALDEPAARAVLAAEFATWTLLAVPVGPAGRLGLLLATLLLAAFTFGIVRTLRRRSPVACNCFGLSTTLVGARHAVRNVLLAAAALGCLAAPAAGGPAGAGHLLVAALAGLVTGLVTTALDEIVALFRPLPDTRTPRAPVRPSAP
ncbi:MauE/DoxX family redox-associated membrane protein [Streptomyces sp. NPDC056257]|uniref:MauE/DoxX family redox-associated membrane protein n=1 Tax=Streptomyces sp. NPDC056257 TaxID=3345765 RepID=UPI0035E2BEF4